MDMFGAEVVNVCIRAFFIIFFIPVGGHLQTFVNREDAVPVEFCMGLVAIQFEKIRLVKGLRGGEVFPGTIAPVFDKPIGHFGGRQMAAVIGAEVPGSGIFFRILPQGGARE